MPKFFLFVYKTARRHDPADDKHCTRSHWLTEGVWGVQPPRNPEFPPKSYQTQHDFRKLLNVSKFRTTQQDVRKKGSKILELPTFAIVLH